MANNCDYCHKPLSLMRRLRGEQFCSVEHLDAYSSQQAEFALERLAASVTDAPNTARPPALLKPAPRVRPIAASAEAPAEAPQEVRVSAGSVAVQEREVEVTPVEEAAPEYPMAPYLDQADILPREAELTEDRKIGFEPVDNWGKVAQGWSMPPFRSEPSDPRTWNAGKLVAQIPPVAGWRELLAPRPLAEEVEAEEARAEGLFILDAGTREALATPAPVAEWSGMTTLAGNQLASAHPVATRLRTQASSFEWHQVSGAQFPPAAVVQGHVPFAGAAIPELRVALPQAPASRPKTAGAVLLEAATPIGTEDLRVSLPLPDEWSWTRTIQVPRVAMPEISPARLGAAAAVGAVEWDQLQGTVQGPAARWADVQLGHAQPNFGWEAAPAKHVVLESLLPQDAAYVAHAPLGLEMRTEASTSLLAAVPCLWRNWAALKFSAVSFAVGPVSTTSMDATWLPLIRLNTASLRPRKRLVPAATAGLVHTVRLAKPPAEAPAARTEIQQAGPVKYSPVAIVVVPPPQFAVLPAALTDEQRYVSQAPNGVWRLPRIRHTGYRALGPFPKLPLRMPDGYLRAARPEMAPRADGLRLGAESKQDLSGMPQFAAPNAVRIHPADYLSWPQPKGLKLGRMLPERVAQEATAPQIKRFGPGRAGLQSRARNADGLARA